MDNFDHSLQAATRAERAGADRELVVAALLHDAGKAVTSRGHDRVARGMLAGAVRPRVAWMIGVHQDFTAIQFNNGRGRWARYRHVLHPGYGLAKRFVDEWDLPSRDPEYEPFPLEHFVPIVHEVFSTGDTSGSDPWQRGWRTIMNRLPAPVADSIERVTRRPRTGVRVRVLGWR
jgi:predicted HD phosphohydrolase